jgi:uncharacterized protein (TIGR02246 family)
MKGKWLAAAMLFSGAVLPASADDVEMVKVRQAMHDRYATAVANKDPAAAATNYATDAIIQSLCPESARAFGREAYEKRVEAALKAGFRDYAGHVKEAHRLGDDLGWSTSTYAFTISDRDGKAQQVRGNSLEMLRREGNEWRVSFQAFARMPCSP